jgi:DNA-binding NarL/FixJ family response regulator
MAEIFSFDDERSVPSLRVLVVDDYEPFRRFVCSTLRKISELQIVGEASDGLEAVRKADELQPDLIVLDIGLPTLNGIEVIRRLRKLCPKCKVLVVSQQSSADVMQEVFSLGGLGYVVKANAGSELLPAVAAVRQGIQFINSGLSAHNSTHLTVPQAPDSLCYQAPLSSALRKKEITRSHEAQFYLDDESFLVGFSCFIEAALKAGTAVIAIAHESHRESLFQRLHARGVDIVAAIEQGRYLALDVDATLSTFMVNDLPDPARVFKVGSDLIAKAAKAATGKHPRVAACGECAPILWAQGKADAAIQLEHLWDETAKRYDVDILCGYILKSFQREQESHIYQKICAEHSAVYSQ